MKIFFQLMVALAIGIGGPAIAKETKKPSLKVEPANRNDGERIQGWARSKDNPVPDRDKQTREGWGQVLCGGRTYSQGDPALSECQRGQSRFQTPENTAPGMLPQRLPVTGGDPR